LEGGVMDIQEKQAQWALEKPLFEAEFIHSHLLPFFNFNENTGDYEIKSEFVDDEDKELAFEFLNTGWVMWLRAKQAKAKAVPEGFVLVSKKDTEDWYLDEYEGMWWEHDGIDSSLCELDICEVQAVEHKEYLITESNTLYATRVWGEENQDIDCWKFFESKEEAEKAAAYCKAKFNDEPIEAQEPAND
jgi:hypothetical protein